MGIGKLFLVGKRPGSGERRRYSLRFQLLFALTIAMVVVLAGFGAWDYHRQRVVQLEQKRTALENEANALLPGVQASKEDDESVQQYIDMVCGRMGPGHHIAVEVGDRLFHAQVSHYQPGEMLAAVSSARETPGNLAEFNDAPIVVGYASSDDTAVYVIAHAPHVRAIVRAQLARRLLSIVALGVVLAVVVTQVIGRLVVRPIETLVGAVRLIRTGELGAQVPATGSLELDYLAGELNSMSSALAEADRERQHQMEKARRVQEHLKPDPAAYEGLSVAEVYQPAAEVAGDYFDIVRRDQGKLVVCVADVTGHGVPAAMGAAMLKVLFASATEQADQPEAILERIHDGFSLASLEEDFVTMIVALIDPNRGRIRYASAGHEPGYLFRRNGDIEVLGPTGPLAGIDSLTGWDVRDLSVSSGDRVLIVTDGITDATSPAGERFGPQRVQSILQINGTLPVDELASLLLDKVAEHLDGGQQRDDMTVVLLEA